MFAGFCGRADKNHIYTVLTVTTSPLKATITLTWHSVKMCLTPLSWRLRYVMLKLRYNRMPGQLPTRTIANRTTASIKC